jgi:nucleoside-diphosphate-sugar epimerase
VNTVLVTGSSGFLGARVVSQALNEGYKVIGVDINPPLDVPPKNFEFWQIDINDIDIYKVNGIDLIVHTASSLPYGNSAEQFLVNNINAAKLIAKLAKVTNAFLVEIGSSSVYGKPRTVPVNRTTPIDPLDKYARSKAKAEIVIANELEESQYCVVRPRTILGTGRSGIFSIFFSLIAGNLPLPLPNSGRQTIQFVHVEDLAALSIFLGTNRISGIWPAASPNEKTLKDYLKLISNKYNVEIRYLPINPSLFKILGGIAFKLKLTKFTPWHFGAFPYDNFVDEKWIPNGFSYSHTSSEAFLETYLSNNKTKHIFPKKLKIGKKI